MKDIIKELETWGKCSVVVVKQGIILCGYDGMNFIFKNGDIHPIDLALFESFKGSINDIKDYKHAISIMIEKSLPF